MKEAGNRNPMKIIRNFMFAFIGLAVAYFIYGQFFLPRDTLVYDTSVTSYNTGWFEIKEDGTRQKLTIPGAYQDHIVMENVLPAQLGQNNIYIELRGEKTAIYVDGKLRISYDNKDKRAFSSRTTEAYVMARLYPEDAGKTIRVEMSGMAGVLYPVNIGSLFGIWGKVFERYFPEIILALLTIFLGVLAIVCCLFLRKRLQKIAPLIYLCIGICLAALWIIFNSAMRELYCNNIGMATDMCFVMIMLTPFPIMLYLNELQQNRYQTAFFIAGMAEVVEFVVCMTLHVLGIRDLHEVFPVILLGALLAIFIVGITIFLDFKNNRIKEYSYVGIGLLCVAVASSLQLISFAFRRDAFSGIFLAIGLLLVLIFSVIHTIHDASMMIEKKKNAELASEAKGQFLANMSHEIRTPINAVLGMNEMILRESGEKAILEYATDIKAAGSSLLSLVNDILDFSKIEAGKMDLVPVEYDFAKLIHAVIIMTRPKAEGKGLKFLLDIDKELPRGLYGDDAKLRQVILNILSNAVKYTETGSVTFHISGYYVLEDIMLDISIKDTGIGIRAEDIDKLYSEFERFDQSKNHMVEGTGLGMSITQRLLDMMGSRLVVESEYGKGSCFSFKIRQKVINHDKIGEITEEGRKNRNMDNEDKVILAPEARVLVVDDKMINRKVFCNLVKKMQMQVEQAASGAECLQLVEKTVYDIIFLDHMMPDMDGIETMKRIKQMPGFDAGRTKLIVLTANAVKGAREQYLEDGFDDYISKPILPENLRQLLRKYLTSYTEITEEEYERRQQDARAVSVAKKTEKPDTAEISVWEQLAQVKGLDLAAAREFNPEPEMMEEALRGVYLAMDEDLMQLDGQLAQLSAPAGQMPEKASGKRQCLNDYRIKVHSMKSSLKLIGATELSEEAFALEQAAREGETEFLKLHTEEFLNRYRTLKEELAFLEKPQKPGLLDAEQDKEIIRELLKMLCSAMEELDIDKADGLIRLLGMYRLPKQAQGTWENLKKAVKNLDIEAVSAAAGEALRQL